MSQTYVYPFDPTGSLTSNVIPNERHVLSEVPSREFSFIVPKFAPFFGRGFRIRHLGLSRDLVEGVDYHLTHWFHAGSHGVGRQLYGSITFIDKRLTGVVELRYQTIGGDWVYDENTILEIMSNRLINPRITTWEQVVDLPFQFPVIDHEWALDDLTGASEVVAKLQAITEAINAANEANGSSHVSDYTNPHGVTKAQVGLGSVENLPLANIAEARGGISNEHYMTPQRVRNFSENYVPPLVEAHTNRADNPHGVNKTQIGLGNVQNYGVAGVADAISGISSTLYMTPMTVKSAIDTNVIPLVSAHTNDVNNPHGVTKVQVGLGSVPNYSVSSEAEAIAGSRNDRFMTPLTTYQLVNEYIGEGMNQHISNTNNPHRVTKTQVGLGSVENFGVATPEEAVAGLSNTLYVTPMGLNKAITDVALAGYRVHTNDAQNPHGVTKSQVGLGNVDNYPTATVEEALAGTTSNRFMTPVTTAAVLANIVGESLEGHTLLRDNPHRVNKTQVGLGNVENYGVANQVIALEGTSDSHYMTPYTSTLLAQSAANFATQQHVSNKANPHGVTAAQIGATTMSEVMALVNNYLPLGVAADNAMALDGHTYQEIIDTLAGGVAEDTIRFDNNTYSELLAKFTTAIAPLATKVEGKSADELEASAISKVPAPTNITLKSFDSTDPMDRGWSRVFRTPSGQFEAILSINNQTTYVTSTYLIGFVADDTDHSLNKFTSLLLQGDPSEDTLWMLPVDDHFELWIGHAGADRGVVHCTVLSTETIGELTHQGETFEQEPTWSLWTPEALLGVTTERVLIDDVKLKHELDLLAEEMRSEVMEAITG